MMKMKLGMIRPTYPNEKRVALLPEHVKAFENELVVEHGFGEYLDIPDEAYAAVGCTLASREEVFASCEAIFSLKLIQPHDYSLLRKGQMIVGWTHPEVSGLGFMEDVGFEKELMIVDLDNICPTIQLNKKKIQIPWIPMNFVHRNSFIAGYAATQHAFMSFGKLADSNQNIAILGSGNVSQGAFSAVTKMGASQVRMYYRKTMNQLKDELDEVDVLINGIELDAKHGHLVTKEELAKMKPNSLIIDAAADADRTIEGTDYTTIDDPLYKKDGLYYYCVANAPAVLYREASYAISKSFSKWVYQHDLKMMYTLAKKIK
ncbi:NAD(P)-dependent oxidoreductase [Lacticigenium naphthae]|uniref:NAD(P)-dependent oxidoreductase n=1 Tax=Lacticigenium naphthae TaxID=515351 RepID=UPI000428098D|nr:NAD(P)-dependent oxidoreductase [Lacticigenium naphthae]